MDNDMPKQPTICDACPVIVDIENKNLFIKKLNERSGKQYRLPTLLELAFCRRQQIISDAFGKVGKDDFRLARNE